MNNVCGQSIQVKFTASTIYRFKHSWAFIISVYYCQNFEGCPGLSIKLYQVVYYNTMHCVEHVVLREGCGYCILWEHVYFGTDCGNARHEYFMTDLHICMYNHFKYPL